MERRIRKMPDFVNFLIYLLVCAGVTYLVRMLPLVFFRKKIENRFIRSFLHYVPYTVLTAMTVPAILYSTGNILSASIGTLVAILLAYIGQGLLTVAIGAVSVVFITELIMMLL